MNMRDLDHAAIETQRIRDLQSRFPVEHSHCKNWGEWVLDLRGMYPTMKPPSVWNNFKRSLVEEWGDEQETDYAVIVEVKAERVEQKEYDEKTAIALDERMASGMMCPEIRRALKVAYASREVPEYQFPRNAGCGLDAFCERLEAGYLFVRRFM